MAMTENDDKLIEQFLATGRRDIADNGFTRRVMRRLPDRSNRLAQIWTALCFTLAAVLFVALDGKRYDDRIEAIRALQAIASRYAIGRDMHIGDTIIGIKGRVGFEAAAPMVIIKAHHMLEKHTLTKWQLFWKDQLAAFYGNYLHEGQYYDPVMRDFEAFLESTQRTVSGDVYVELHPYRFVLVGIKSDHDLMSSKFGAYGETMNDWTSEDVQGFGKIFGNQNKIYYKVNKDQLP